MHLRPKFNFLNLLNLFIRIKLVKLRKHRKEMRFFMCHMIFRAQSKHIKYYMFSCDFFSIEKASNNDLKLQIWSNLLTTSPEDRIPLGYKHLLCFNVISNGTYHEENQIYLPIFSQIKSFVFFYLNSKFTSWTHFAWNLKIDWKSMELRW